jgi:hypothetical protein
MQWLIPVATAAWAIWTWTHDHERERQREKTRMAALYASPFLSACEKLQSRIYKLLLMGELAELRERYPDSSCAEETLDLLVRFFGWSTAVNAPARGRPAGEAPGRGRLSRTGRREPIQP